MRALLGLALLSLAGATSVFAQAEAPDLTVQALAMTAGPYGQMWEFNLAADGSVELKVVYMLSGPGNLEGRFSSAKHRVETVRAAILKERFMELPSEISPEMVTAHQPDLRLSITLGDQTHKVRIYSPERMGKDLRARRFLAVWKAVFQHVPIQPTW